MSIPVFLEKFRDESLIVSPSYLNDRNQKAILVFDYFNLFASEWFSKAVKEMYGQSKLLGSAVKSGVKGEKVIIPNDVIEIYLANLDHSLDNFVVTNDCEDYFLYIPQFGDYYLIAGCEEFVAKAMPVSYTTIKLQYFESVKAEYELNGITDHPYADLWNIYEKIR